MRRRSALTRRLTLEHNLRILKRLSPIDYNAVAIIVADVVERRLKHIDQTPIWRETKRHLPVLAAIAWSL